MESRGIDTIMIAIVASLKKEVEPFFESLTGAYRRRIAGRTLWEGSFRGIPVRIVLTGVGADLASKVLEGCRVAVSTGFCGALEPGMTCGDLVLSREVTYAGEELLGRITAPRETSRPFEGTGLFRLPADDRLRSLLLEKARTMGLALHVGRSVSCPRVIRNGTEKRRLSRYFDALSVDMEDYLRVGVGKRLGVQVLCMRAVLDELEDDVPSFRRGVKLRGAVSLYRKIPGVQKSIDLLLGETVAFLADTIEIA
jgi:nucleoside phosphorylase